MSLQSEIIKSLGAMGAAKGIYKASPEYAEKMRLKGLNDTEIKLKTHLEALNRRITEYGPESASNQNVDYQLAHKTYDALGANLEEQGKYDEAVEHYRGEERYFGELDAYMYNLRKSSNSTQYSRATKAMQSDMTDNLRDFYRKIRLGGTIDG